MGRHSEDFLVRPLDTVWFRGPRPFVAGEDSSDPGLFPPTPWTFQGLVRTRLLAAAVPGDLDRVDRETISALVGPPDRLPEGWRLEGPFPAQDPGTGRLEPWFPAPRFLLQPDDGGEPVRARNAPGLPAAGTGDARPLAMLSDHGPGRLLLGHPRRASRPLGGWIGAGNLRWALTGEGSWDGAGSHRPDLPPFVAPEVRPGVQVERKSGTAVDHMLYTGTHHRFKAGAGLLGRLIAETDARVPGDALARGWGQAGRKGRLVELLGPVEVDPHWVQLRAGTHLELPADAVPDPLRAWVTLLTPALAVEPGPPFPLPASGAELKVLGHLGGPGPDVGGFDLAAVGGRPLRATWAAGSCWLVEIRGGSAEARLAAARQLQGLRPYIPGAAEAVGFGQRAVGLLDPETYRPIRGGGDA